MEQPEQKVVGLNYTSQSTQGTFASISQHVTRNFFPEKCQTNLPDIDLLTFGLNPKCMFDTVLNLIQQYNGHDFIFIFYFLTWYY